MRAELDALQRSLRVPMVLITHDPLDVEMFGEQVLRMHQGAVQPSQASETVPACA